MQRYGLEEKLTVGAAEGRKLWSWIKVRERKGLTEEHTMKTLPQSHCLGKQEGLIFMNSCNQWGLKIGVLEVQWAWLGYSPEDTAQLLKANNPGAGGVRCLRNA